MKKITNCLVLIVLFFSTFTLSAQYVAPVRTLTVQSITEPIQIDGIADESSWSEDQILTVFIESGWTDDLDFSGYFKITWDLDFLYFFADIKDDVDHSACSECCDPWMFDCIDIVIDLDTNNHSTEYDENTIELRLNRGERGFTFPGRADVSDYEYIIINNPITGWCVEAAIPWKAALPEGSSSEDIFNYISNYIGFDVVFNDSDGSDPDYGERDAQMAWDRDDDPAIPDYEYFMWCNTHVFGIITLTGNIVGFPEADAGPDQTVDENTMVYLDGTGSSDAGGSELTYTWTAPEPISLSDIHSPTPSFLAPDVKKDTEYQIFLVVRNDSIYSHADPVTITVKKVNIQPVANAGPDTSVYEGDVIYFDGSLSFDADGDSLSFIWRSADNLLFNDFTSISPAVMAPIVNTQETYSFTLTVSDGESNSVPDTVLVSVINVTSIESYEKGSDEVVLIYPNPTGQYIHIESEVLISEIEILDLTGNILYIVTMNSKNADLDLSKISTGYYLVKLKTEAGYILKKISIE
jgi:hypothetical protein